MLSIVPRSHSRDTISAVSSVPVIVITMAITPGTMKSADCSRGLNQSRICRSMPPADGLAQLVRLARQPDLRAPET